MELAGIAKSPVSAFYEDTDVDESAEVHQGQGGFIGACQPAWQREPGLQDARLYRATSDVVRRNNHGEFERNESEINFDRHHRIVARRRS